MELLYRDVTIHGGDLLLCHWNVGSKSFENLNLYAMVAAPMIAYIGNETRIREESREVRHYHEHLLWAAGRKGGLDINSYLSSVKHRPPHL